MYTFCTLVVIGFLFNASNANHYLTCDSSTSHLIQIVGHLVSDRLLDGQLKTDVVKCVDYFGGVDGSECLLLKSEGVPDELSACGDLMQTALIQSLTSEGMLPIIRDMIDNALDRSGLLGDCDSAEKDPDTKEVIKELQETRASTLKFIQEMADNKIMKSVQGGSGSFLDMFSPLTEKLERMFKNNQNKLMQGFTDTCKKIGMTQITVDTIVTCTTQVAKYVTSSKFSLFS